MQETGDIASAFNQGGRSYHGAVQLDSIQLKGPCCVEKTELGFTLFQPARIERSRHKRTENGEIGFQ